MIQSPLLTHVGRIDHGFFTRQGGVSTGIYESLNCGFGSADDRAAVAANRERCAARLGIGAGGLLTAYQVHEVTVATVDAPWQPQDAPRADAMVTRRPGIALGILAADCAPVLLADGVAGVIGAAHAGWKGAKAGVIEAVVAAMVGLGAERPRIAAAIGPCIAVQSYEVGPEFRQSFVADDPATARFFLEPSGGRPHFDLGAFVARRLEEQGLGGIERIAADTCAEPDRFFSYRRSCQNTESDYGRQLSAIVLR